MKPLTTEQMVRQCFCDPRYCFPKRSVKDCINYNCQKQDWEHLARAARKFAAMEQKQQDEKAWAGKHKPKGLLK